MIQFMLDIETLGSRPGSPIIQFAVVAFDDADPRVLELYPETFVAHLDVDEQFALGVRPDWDAIAFWMAQGDEAKAEVFKTPANGRQSTRDAMGDLKQFLDRVSPGLASRRLWSRGPDFDVGSLRMLCHLARVFWPFPYNATRDVRTILEQVPVDRIRDVVPDTEEHWRMRPLVKHAALDDCVVQARQVCRAIKVLRAPPGHLP